MNLDNSIFMLFWFVLEIRFFVISFFIVFLFEDEYKIVKHFMMPIHFISWMIHLSIYH